MRKPVTATPEQLKELHRLARALRASAEATDIRKRFKAFIEDNEEALRVKDGVELDGLRLSVRVTKHLEVEEL